MKNISAYKLPLAIAGLALALILGADSAYTQVGGCMGSLGDCQTMDYKSKDETEKQQTQQEFEPGTPQDKFQQQTDAQKKLQEIIDKKLADQKAGKTGSTDDKKDTKDTVAEEKTNTTIKDSLIDIAKEASNGDEDIYTYVGNYITTAYTTILDSIAAMPDVYPCSDGGQLKDYKGKIEDEFKDSFLKKESSFKSQASKVNSNASLKSFLDDYNKTLNNMVYDISKTVTEKGCGTSTVASGNNNSGNSSSGGSGGSGGIGGLTPEEMKKYGINPNDPYNVSGGQSLPPGADPENEAAAVTNPNNPEYIAAQNLPAPATSSYQDPSGMSFGADSMFLRIQSSHKTIKDAVQCTFWSNNGPVTSCTKELDKVLRDRLYLTVASQPVALYKNLWLVAKMNNSKVIEPGGNKWLISNSGYRSPALNKSVGGASGSCHMRPGANDTVFPDVPPSKAFSACVRAKKGGCGRYANFTHIDACSVRQWG